MLQFGHATILRIEQHNAFKIPDSPDIPSRLIVLQWAHLYAQFWLTFSACVTLKQKNE